MLKCSLCRRPKRRAEPKPDHPLILETMSYTNTAAVREQIIARGQEYARNLRSAGEDASAVEGFLLALEVESAEPLEAFDLSKAQRSPQTRMAERFEDMSPRGRLRVFQQNDGDMVVAIVPDPTQHPDAELLSVEFCSPGSGGGKSPQVVEALRALMHAMAHENQSKPHCSRRGEFGLGVDD